MQLIYRGQTYSYPYSETVESSTYQSLCVYRGVKASVAPGAPRSNAPAVTSMCYRGISYLKTLTPMFNGSPKQVRMCRAERGTSLL